MIGYFLLGSIFPNTDFGQVGSLVDLFEHYQEHKLELQDPNLSFFTFFKMHFIQPESHDHPDHDNHEDLPFHQISPSIDLITITTLLKSDDPELIVQLDNFIVKSLSSFEFLEQVYRPPSLA